MEPTPPDRLIASHFNVVNDIRFVVAAILDFNLQEQGLMLKQCFHRVFCLSKHGYTHQNCLSITNIKKFTCFMV